MGAAFEQKTISNHDPDAPAEIAGTSLFERKLKNEKQAARRARQERQQDQRTETDSLKELAEYDSLLAKNFLQECKNILRDNLAAGKFNWVSYYKDEPYPPFVFKEPLPRYEQIAKEMGIIRKNPIKEFLLPSVKKRRLQMENEARQTLELKLEQYQKRQDSARAAYETKRKSLIEEQSEYNSLIDQLRLDLEKGRPGAVESFIRAALAVLRYPDALEVVFDARYEQAGRLIVVEAVFPTPLEIPRVVRYQYDQEEHGIVAVKMNEKEFANFYEEILLQLSLSAIHLIFESTRDRQIQQVGYNGRVGETAPETDLEELNPCILTCKVSRDIFSSVNLTSVSSREAFLRFNGISSGPLAELKPIQPIQVLPKNLSHDPDLDPSPDMNTSTADPKPYQPGDIENIAKELMLDLLDQIENNLEKKRGPDDIIH